MKKLIDKINQKENLILVVCILIIFACIIFFFYNYGKKKEANDNFVINDHLQDEVLSITSDTSSSVSVKLQEFSYYIIVAEANTQEQALFFREETPVNYWELKTAPLENVRALTKKFCIDTCIKDNILYMEALEHDIQLTDDEYSYMEDVSYEIYTHLTGDQVGVTSIEFSDIVEVQKKIFLAEKYILSFLENGTVKEKSELSADGTYYLDYIKTQYNIEENKQVVDQLVFGSITVNIPKE